MIRPATTRPADEGATLVEVLVAMVVAGVLATAVMITVVQTLQSTRSADGRQDRAAQARVALDGATTDLRTASTYTTTKGVDVPAFDRITPTEVVFRGNLSNFATASGTADSAPTLFRIALDTTDAADPKLVEQRWTTTSQDAAGAWVYSSAPASTRVLAHRVQPVGGEIFTPYSKADIAAAAAGGAERPVSSVPRNADRSIAPAGLKAVVGLQIAIAVAPPTGETGGAATFSNYVDFVSKVG